MKQFLITVFVSILLSKVNANSDFCSAYNLINHIQTKFENKQNITDLLKDLQKISALTIQKFYIDLKHKNGRFFEEALQTSPNKDMDRENLKKIGSIFGESSASVFGEGALFNLCDISREYDEIYDQLSPNIKQIFTSMISQLESLFNSERADIYDQVLARNVDIVLGLKNNEPKNMHNLVNMFQIYKEITIPDMCSFQKASDQIKIKFFNPIKMERLLLNYQIDLASLVQNVIVPNLTLSRKWLINEILTEDSKHMNELYKLIEDTKNRFSLIDLCQFKEDLNNIKLKFKLENQLIIEQLEIHFYETLFQDLADFRKAFIRNNQDILMELDSLEPYNTHELGDLYKIWKPNGIGNACTFQNNLNGILDRFETKDGRQYINEFILKLQSYLKDEAKKVFFRLEIQNEKSLQTILDEKQQDYIHYQKMKQTIFDDMKFDSIYDMCTMSSLVNKITRKFLPDNAVIVERLISIVMEDLFVKRIDTIYGNFLSENTDLIYKMKETQDFYNFLHIGRIYGFLKTNESTELFQIILKFKK